MNILTLEETKQHLRVTNNAEDSIIALYIAGAQEYITNFLNQEIPGLGDSPVFVPSSIRCAALLVVGDMYENRQGQTAGVENYKNPMVENLLWPYRTNMGV